MREESRILLFALIICLVCSSALALVYTGLRGNQLANEKQYEQRNVLQAFGYTEIDGATTNGAMDISAERVLELFDTRIERLAVDTNGVPIEGIDFAAKDTKSKIKSGDVLPIYRFIEKEGADPKFAFPIDGYGLWGTIYGYCALESDLSTLAGVTFYKHKETPGLGAECSKPWFQEQFIGKRLCANDGSLAILKVVKGKRPADVADDPYAVGGISAATITANGIQTFINEDMARYDKYFSKIRKG